MKTATLLKKIQGATLIELVVYLALFSIVLLISIDLMVMSSETGAESSAKNSLNQDSNFILNRMEYDMQRAESIFAPTAPSQVTNYLWLTIGGQDYVYFVNLNKVQLYINGTWHDLSSSFVTAPSAMRFENVGTATTKSTIKAKITLRSTDTPKGGPLEKTFETVFGLR